MSTNCSVFERQKDGPMITLLDSKELAAELKIPLRTLDQWSYAGVGPAFLKVGRHRRYRRSDVDAWLDAHRHGGDTV